MKAFIGRLVLCQSVFCVLQDFHFLELTKGMEPIWYYEKQDGSIEILEEKVNPRDWSVSGREKSLISDDLLEINYVKNVSHRIAVKIVANISQRIAQFMKCFFHVALFVKEQSSQG